MSLYSASGTVSPAEQMQAAAIQRTNILKMKIIESVWKDICKERWQVLGRWRQGEKSSSVIGQNMIKKSWGGDASINQKNLKEPKKIYEG